MGVAVLDEIFSKYSNGLLLMNKSQLIAYYKDVYPALSEQSTYSERATYILSKYGQTLAVIKQQLHNVLSANKDSTLNKMEIVDAYINKRKHVANKDEEDTKINEDNADDEKESNSHLKSNHFRIAIEE